MISKRAVALTVGLLALAATGVLILSQRRPEPDPTPSPPPRAAVDIVRLTARLPAEKIEDVDRLLLLPLTEVVRAAEGIICVESTCWADGTCVIIGSVDTRVDRAGVIATVQSRLNRLSPSLPNKVIDLKLTLEPDVGPTLWLALTSQGGRHNAVGLSNEWRQSIRDKVVGMPGVLGASAYGTLDQDRILIEPEVGRQPSPVDVPALPLSGGSGRAAKREFAEEDTIAVANGVPAVLIALTQPRDATTITHLTREIGSLRRSGGPRLEIAADLRSDRVIRIDVGLDWADAGTDGKRRPNPLRCNSGEVFRRYSLDREGCLPDVMNRACERLRQLDGNISCYAFTCGRGRPATVLVKLPPENTWTPADVRRALPEEPGVTYRVCHPGNREMVSPVRLAVLEQEGGVDGEFEAVRALAAHVTQDGVVADLSLFPGRPNRTAEITVIDDPRMSPDQARALVAALATQLGTLGNPDDIAKQVERLMTPSPVTGQLVALKELVRVVVVPVPAAIYRVDGRRAYVLHADPAHGRIPAEVGEWVTSVSSRTSLRRRVVDLNAYLR